VRSGTRLKGFPRQSSELAPERAPGPLVTKHHKKPVEFPVSSYVKTLELIMPDACNNVEPVEARRLTPNAEISLGDASVEPS
jgi:hypothetical protein